MRWSSAKGIGRISSRLPQDLASEVVDSVIALFIEDSIALKSQNNLNRLDQITSIGMSRRHSEFNNNTFAKEYDLSAVSDFTWHGACLAIAELARRGILMPEKLQKVVPWITLV